MENTNDTPPKKTKIKPLLTEEEKVKRREYLREWKRKNPDKVKAYQVDYVAKSVPQRMAYKKKYYAEHPEAREKAKATGRIYDKEKRKGRHLTPEYRAKVNQWSRDKRVNDPIHRLTANIRCSFSEALKKNGETKSERVISLLGCTMQQFRDHIESQFWEGMTWENYGEWQVDHRLPVSSFDMSLPWERAACWHYANMQPLWAADNLAKSNRLDWSFKDSFLAKATDLKSGSDA